MRIWTILLFTLAFNFGLAVFSNPDMGLTGGGGTGQLYYNLTSENLNYTSTDEVNTLPSSSILSSEGGTWATSAKLLFGVTIDATVYLPFMLLRLGFPPILATAITVFTALLYVVAGAQFIRGMKIEGSK